ncbi:MAG: helix-turn-helix transcriptional regulator, partial [Actinobacteria bacterium]|nr:helix-turn-helix transcriptional regulator [Actinomycetota bacterium]
MRDAILATARELILISGVVPSLNAVADAAGVSKGGLMHHFPSRAALIAGLAREAIAEMDREMVAAAADGSAARTWLRLSL